MIGVCVVGAGGRMGRLIVTALASHPTLRLSAAIESSESPLIGQIAGGAVAVTSDLERGVEGCGVVLDFSTPKISLQVVEVCRRRRKPLLIGTTGHSPAERSALREYAPTAPLLLAPNTSVGVSVLTQLARSARAMLGPSFDVEIVEVHHAHKKDAPSGTARLLADSLRDEPSGAIVVDRGAGGGALREAGEIGIASVRGGDIPGDHTVMFLGAGERLELVHRVRDRSVFAEGAVRLAAALVGRPAGFYEVRDILAST